MTECKFKKRRRWLLGFYLMIFATLSTSCSKDYFVDESNFSIYVPQIKEGTIQNFYVAFYDASGHHVRTRQLTAPFNNDPKMQEGILRFKLPAGTYSISCFANYDPQLITVGSDLANSSLNEGVVNAAEHIYAANETNPRMVFKTDVAVVPLGTGDGLPYEINIDTPTRFKGNIITEFIDLPSNITRIDMLHSQISNRVSFGGLFGLFAPADRVMHSASVADMSVSGTTKKSSYLLNPSAGLSFPARDTDSPLKMGFEIQFYDGTNMVGTSTYPSITGLNNPPIYDIEGNLLDINTLVLHPQEVIRITFKGFTIIKIQLMGWDGIDQGEVTPI